MSEHKAGLFPTHADEEQMVYGLTMNQAIIIFGAIGFIAVTRMVLVGVVLGFVAWKFYSKYREHGQRNIVMQLAYKIGLYVPKSHIFAEPGIDSFRE